MPLLTAPATRSCGSPQVGWRIGRSGAKPAADRPALSSRGTACGGREEISPRTRRERAITKVEHISFPSGTRRACYRYRVAPLEATDRCVLKNGEGQRNLSRLASLAVPRRYAAALLPTECSMWLPCPSVPYLLLEGANPTAALYPKRRGVNKQRGRFRPGGERLASPERGGVG
jgi:hypothetical protein